MDEITITTTVIFNLSAASHSGVCSARVSACVRQTDLGCFYVVAVEDSTAVSPRVGAATRCIGPAHERFALCSSALRYETHEDQLERALLEPSVSQCFVRAATWTIRPHFKLKTHAHTLERTLTH